MRVKSVLLGLTLVLGLASGATAQSQVSAHAVPIGRGPGVTNFNSAPPGTSGLALLSNGAASDPTFQTNVPGGSAAGDLSGTYPNPSVAKVLGIPYSLSVESTGRFGLDSVGGQFIFQTVGAPAFGYGAALRDQGAFSYTGGTPGQVNSTHATITTVSANVADYIWGNISLITNGSTAGQNVATYSQATKTSTGPTWGEVAEVIDSTGTADPVGGSAINALEVDVNANGTDANNTRLGVHSVLRKAALGGANVEGADAFRIFADVGAKWKKGLNFYTGSNIGTGIDISGATISGDAIHLADSQKIALDTADTRSLKFDGTRLVYGTPTSANALRVSDDGFLGVGVAPAVAFDAAGTGTTQMRLVDGGSVDMRVTASSGSAAGFVGTVSDSLLILETNGTERVRLGAGVNTGAVTITGNLGRGAPVTKTADFTVAVAENWLIVNKAGTTTVTLPSASDFTGREIMVKTIQAQTVVSVASNVVPEVGGAAGTAILAATAGKWATLVSDGTNWVVMESN